MKIALVNLCNPEDFKKHLYYQDVLDYLHEEKIDYLDLASGKDTLESLIDTFNQSLDTDAELFWFIRGGFSCLNALDKIDWEKVTSGNKKFYGLSDFTHFAHEAVAKGVKCFYGQGLTKIKKHYPERADRNFITEFLKTGSPNPAKAKPLLNATTDLDLSQIQIAGGHMGIFAFMQSNNKIDLSNRHLFLEYHSSSLEPHLLNLDYEVDHVLYSIKENLPKSIILGQSLIRKIDGTFYPEEELTGSILSKFSKTSLPVYYINHFNNVIPLS